MEKIRLNFEGVGKSSRFLKKAAQKLLLLGAMGVGGGKAHTQSNKLSCFAGGQPFSSEKEVLRATSDQMKSFDRIKLLAKTKS